MMCMKTVLIIDNDEIALNSLARQLEDEQFTVAKASNAKQGLHLLESLRFNCVVTDCISPGNEQFKILKEVKNISPETSVIILSPHGDISLATEALHYGADNYLLKPCNFSEIFFCLSLCISRQRKQQENTNEYKFLPICSHCKKVRDDEGKAFGTGTWCSIEEYLYCKMHICCSHGYCPDCFQRVVSTSTGAIEMKGSKTPFNHFKQTIAKANGYYVDKN